MDVKRERKLIKGRGKKISLYCASEWITQDTNDGMRWEKKLFED